MIGVAVIVPALNEAENIRWLVIDLKETLPVDVIVVDNGSTDGTRAEARSAGARVVYEPRRGYGYACASGVSAAGDAEILVFIDADYSFLPSELPDILSPIQEGKADLVLGSRELGQIERGAMPAHQRFGNWLVARLVKRIYGLSLTDIGPYRAIKRTDLESFNMSEMTYGWPVEMVIKAARTKTRIQEVPVSYRSRKAGRSKVSGTIRGSFRAAISILTVTFRYARSQTSVDRATR